MMNQNDSLYRTQRSAFTFVKLGSCGRGRRGESLQCHSDDWLFNSSSNHLAHVSFNVTILRRKISPSSRYQDNSCSLSQIFRIFSVFVRIRDRGGVCCNFFSKFRTCPSPLNFKKFFFSLSLQTVRQRRLLGRQLWIELPSYRRFVTTYFRYY